MQTPLSSDEKHAEIDASSDISEELSDDDSINWSGGNMKLRVTATALLILGVSPLLGIHISAVLRALALLVDFLYLIPFMAYSDSVVNYIWCRQPARFFSVGRIGWMMLVICSASWEQLLLAALCQAAVHAAVTTLNYFMYHRTLFKYIEERQYRLAMEFSVPINPIQLVACELLRVFLLRRFCSIHLSIIYTSLLGITSFWFERGVAQILVYIRRKESTVGSMRVFFLHWGPSADSGHWLMQVEGTLVHIFKRRGMVTADIARPDDTKDRPEDQLVPSLTQALYIPFLRYGIVGLTDPESFTSANDEWQTFVEDWMKVSRYSVATRSCQEFVIFSMYQLCHPPFFNMSDFKSLLPISVCLVLVHADTVLYATLALAKWVANDLIL